MAPPGVGTNLAYGHNLNKDGRGPLGDASYKISKLYALWLQTNRFVHVFPSVCSPEPFAHGELL